jgi:predicted phage terminase large subunit-like protein
MSLSPSEELELLALLEAEEHSTFLYWLEHVSPEFYWRWDWQLHVQDVLEKVTAGEIRKVMLSLPPQHGKSSLVTERYPVYRLSQNPNLRVIIGSYNQDFARRFGRKTKRLADECGIAATDKESSKAQAEWETPQYGGVVSVGVGSGVTGRSGDLIIIDDPVKSREEAESEAYRERCWNWYTDDLYTRLQQDGAIILIMTRWHEDDLAGRILASEDAPNWTVINLPAEAEENDPLGREIGEALCPERFDKEALADKRGVIGTYGYSALFQGHPTPREGGFFKRHWFETVEAAPASANKVRYWDLAASQDEGDYTVGTLMSRVEPGVYYIEDVRRAQLSPLGVEHLITNTAAQDGQSVKVWMEQEGGSAGKMVISHYAKLLSGYAFRGNHPTGSKELRADPFAAQAEAGNVKLVRGSWNKEWLDEVCGFPLGANDDQVDSADGAFDKLANRRQAAATLRI